MRWAEWRCADVTRAGGFSGPAGNSITEDQQTGDSDPASLIRPGRGVVPGAGRSGAPAPGGQGARPTKTGQEAGIGGDGRTGPVFRQS
jgi:hypothetical protein